MELDYLSQLKKRFKSAISSVPIVTTPLIPYYDQTPCRILEYESFSGLKSEYAPIHSDTTPYF